MLSVDRDAFEEAAVIRSIDDLPNVSGFVQGSVRHYEVPELGWSVPYYTDLGLAATVYIYPCQRQSVVEEHLPAMLATEFDAARTELLGLAGKGAWREVVVLDKSPARVDATALGLGALHDSFVVRSVEG